MIIEKNVPLVSGGMYSLLTKYQYYQPNSKMHKKQKAMFAHSISAFPGGGRCRKAADEAPNKI